MTDVSLRLESVKLSNSEERIKLLVTSLATFQLQDGRFRRGSSDELVDLMESGHVCVTRGPSCDLDFGFAFKKLQLDKADQNALVEKLGHFVLEAPVSLAWIVNLSYIFGSLKLVVVVGTTSSFSFSQTPSSKRP